MSEREARRAEKKSATNHAKHTVNHTATFEEKNFLKAPLNSSNSLNQSKSKLNKSSTPSSTKKPVSTKRKSLININTNRKSSLLNTYADLEQEIKQLQMRTQLDLPIHNHQKHIEQGRKQSINSINLDLNDDLIVTTKSSEKIEMNGKRHSENNSNLQSRLAQIGRLDSKKSPTDLMRSSTPTEIDEHLHRKKSSPPPPPLTNHHHNYDNLEHFHLKSEK